MEMLYNKHYVRLEGETIVKGFSDAFEQPLETDVCINAQGGYQFRLFPEGTENPMLMDFRGIALYKYVDGEVLERTEEDKAEDITKFENAQLKASLCAQLDAIDAKSIRPQRAILTGTGTEADQAYLNDLAKQAIAIREQLRALS